MFRYPQGVRADMHWQVKQSSRADVHEKQEMYSKHKGEGVREMKLTAQQEKFCLEYVRSGNAAQAYKAAYSVTNTGTAKANGSRLLKNPAVQSRIAELQAQVENEKICTAREIQERLSQIARRELYETICLPNGERVQKQTSIRDSCRALELLAKASGMFISKSEVELNGAMPVVIHDDI